MTTVIDELRKAKSGQTVDLTGMGPMAGGEYVSPLTDITLIGPDVLTSQLRVYEPDGWSIGQGLHRDGIQADGSFLTEDATIVTLGGKGFRIAGFDIRNTQGFAQVAIGPHPGGPHGGIPVDWTLEDFRFGAHNRAGILPAGELDPQEHSLYIHENALSGAMGGTIRNGVFEGPNYDGATIKIGGVDDNDGSGREVAIDNVQFGPDGQHHDLELLVVSGTVTVTRMTSKAPATGRETPYSVWCSGNPSTVTITGPAMPCGTLVKPPPTALNTLLQAMHLAGPPKPVTGASGRTVSAGQNRVTWVPA